MEWLKSLLGDDLYKQVAEKLGETKIFKQDDKDWIPKPRFDELNTKKVEAEKNLKKANEDLKTVQTDFDALKAEKDTGKTDLDKQITDLTKQVTDLTAGTEKKDRYLLIERKRTALKEALTGAKVNPKYSNLLIKEFDLEKIELNDDGKIKEPEELLKPVLETYKDMFGEKKMTGDPPEKDKAEPFKEVSAEDYYKSEAK